MIRGDGTGPEVIAEALKVLDAVRDDIQVELVDFDLGADRYLRTGETLPDEDLETMRGLDAILLGAVGDPRVPPGILERDLLLRIRFELDQYVNLRPVIRFPGVQTLVPSHGEDDVNMVVIRENSEGLYSGVGGFHRKGTRHEVAVQSSVNTRHGVERIVRYAFDLRDASGAPAPGDPRPQDERADVRGRPLPAGRARGRDRVPRRDHRLRARRRRLHLLPRSSPSRFDVIVTDNMFGDIITDLGAMIQGGMGIAAGGNINPVGVSMFEPIGGTAPSETGKGTINPLAAIGATGMLLAQLGEERAAARIDAGIRFACTKLASMRAGEMGYSTQEVGDLVVEAAAV